MSEKVKYTWETQADKEIWEHDKFDTIDECLRDAWQNYEIEPGTKIAIGICEDYVPHIDVDFLLDRVGEDAYEEVGEVAEDWPYFESRKGYHRADELQEAIDKVFQEWLVKTNQVPNFYHILPLADLYEVGDYSEEEQA